MSSNSNIVNDSNVASDAQNYANYTNNLTVTETNFKNYNGLDNVFIKK
jgi:hypothetical protein